MTKMSSWQVSVAAEAAVAMLFARVGWNVSVQYGANQPEYDLMVARGGDMLKVSVKGSQDGAWGLTQTFKKGRTYHEAADHWLSRHTGGTIFALVQFIAIDLSEAPRVYLATPREIAIRLKDSAAGRGETILYEEKLWTARAASAGTTDRLPQSWRFSTRRLEAILRALER